MSDEQKEANQPRRVFLKEVSGGVSRELGEASLKEGYKPSRPAYLESPKPVAVPPPPAITSGDVATKGSKPSKPPSLHPPKPIAIPPAPAPSGKESGGKK